MIKLLIYSQKLPVFSNRLWSKNFMVPIGGHSSKEKIPQSKWTEDCPPGTAGRSLWSPLKEAMMSYSTSMWGDIPAKNWDIYSFSRGRRKTISESFLVFAVTLCAMLHALCGLLEEAEVGKLKSNWELQGY